MKSTPTFGTGGLRLHSPTSGSAPLFHSSSAGMTEDAAEVWSARPYLVSVDSPETAEDVPNYVTSVTVSEAGFAETIHSAYPDIQLSGESAFWLGAVTRDGSGRVETVDVGGVTMKGSTLRSVLGLRSACFEWEAEDGKLIFYVTGYGHGVGMSQYGANQMAKEGADYREILTHYYTGVTVEPYTSAAMG